jgi:hypothetical protein
MTMLTSSRLREVVAYDPETGIFRWKVSNRGLVGEIAGSVNNKGYNRICVDGRRYVTGRLAWFYIHGEWPKARIDHRNRKRGDDGIGNLREATPSQNCANRQRRHDNLTGLKGVHRVGDRFQARIGTSAKHLGLFETPEGAHACYLKAAQKRWGDFATSG